MPVEYGHLIEFKKIPKRVKSISEKAADGGAFRPYIQSSRLFINLRCGSSRQVGRDASCRQVAKGAGTRVFFDLDAFRCDGTQAQSRLNRW